LEILMHPSRVVLPVLLLLASCSKSSECDVNQATNKMLAFNRVESRLVSKGGESGMKLSLAISQETAPVTELLAQKRYTEACQKADEIAKRLSINFEEEAKDMLTIEKLTADGGKGNGACSMADAAKKLMEIHGLIQKEVDAGRKSSDVFRDFNQDTLPYAEMLGRDPNEACALLEKVRKKYGV
jgi:hypothetical protein